MSTLRAKLARWVDEWKLALAGVGLAAKFWQFWVTAIVIFIFFGILLNMLALPSSFQYLWNLPDFGRKLSYLGEMFLGVFGYRKDGPADFLPILMIALLQAVLIGLIVVVWRQRKLAREATAVSRETDVGREAAARREVTTAGKKRKSETSADKTAAGADSGAQLSKAGIVTGLAVLAGGCPTCGTSLLAPVLGAIFSGSSAAIGDTISWVLTLLAIIIALLSFKKVGLDAYVIIVSERRRNREKQCKR